MRKRSWAVLTGILVGGALLCYVLLATAPEIETEKEVRRPKLVQVVAVEPRRETIAVEAGGTVVPANQVTIQPQVDGLIVRRHPSLEPGGYLAKGAELLGVDDADYQIALKEQQATLEEAKFELEVEEGRVVVAEHEWEQLKDELQGDRVNRALVLREPHLRRTQALISKAENQIDKAMLDLERTSIKAPFNAMVIEESVEVGQLVKTGDTVATLVGTDEFWVQLAVPVEQLGLIRFPTDDESGGASARVYLETGEAEASPRHGEVLRLLGELEARGRMARVLLRVPDPLNLQPASGGPSPPPLLLGAYVRAEIDAGELTDVLRIDRKALREGGRIWIVDGEDRLQIRKVDVLWRRKDEVLIENCLQEGERLIVSGLRVAVPGTLVNPQPAG